VTILAKRRGDVMFWHQSLYHPVTDAGQDEERPMPASSPRAGMHTISVRFNCVIHDFMMLNQVRETAAADAAIELAIDTLRKAFAQ
jgi:acetyl esterase